MDIEKEVGAKGFSSDFHKAMVNLYFSYKWFEQHTDEVFKKYDLLSQHFNILKIVNGKKEGCSVKDIKDVIMDKGRDLTRLIDKLEAKGFVKRELNPDNRRQMIITITDSGRKVVTIADTALKKKIASINNLSVEESSLLNQLLNKVRG